MTEVFWFSEQPYGHVTDDDLEQAQDELAAQEAAL